MDVKLTQKIADTIRWLAADAVQTANSGHPGMPMGAAEIGAVLAQKLRIDPTDAKWYNRDRFVLSAGHGSMLLYSMLYFQGFLTLEDLKHFRQLGSKTPGHPELGVTPGVDFSTGPLGAGFAAAVGMALAERTLAEMYNSPKYELVDHYTYVLIGDGCNQEGITQEAAALAGHWKLGRLIVIYDSNGIQIDGRVSLADSEDVATRYTALGWHIQKIDGHDPAAIDAAIDTAQKDLRPSLIIANTVIANGAPNKQNTNKPHGAPLGEQEITDGKNTTGWTLEKFYVPAEVDEFFAKHRGELAKIRQAWNEILTSYTTKHATLAKEFTRVMSGELPLNWKSRMPEFPPDEKGMATRVASGMTLATFGEWIGEIVGGSADLAESNHCTLTKGKYTEFVAPEMYLGRNIHFGVREHAMGQIVNGIAAHGGLIPFAATFLVFCDYLRPAIRTAAMSKLRSLFIFTHDSIFVGEDGPTHHPVEQLAALRCIPNVRVFRPADANETAWAYQCALARTEGPTIFALTRQTVPTLDRKLYADARNTVRGGYILERDPEGIAEIVLIASGSEVHLALQVATVLRDSGRKVRVVSMPSLELFKEQPESYRRTVLPMRIKKRCVIEAGVIDGWEGIIGEKGIFIGMHSFGISGKPEMLAEKFGFTVDNVLDKLAEADF